METDIWKSAVDETVAEDGPPSGLSSTAVASALLKLLATDGLDGL